MSHRFSGVSPISRGGVANVIYGKVHFLVISSLEGKYAYNAGHRQLKTANYKPNYDNIFGSALI